MITVPMKTGRGLNDREHFMVTHRRVRREGDAVGWYLRGAKPKLPVLVTLTRVSPSHKPLDDDNLVGALKTTRDAVAKWLGVDDGELWKVRFAYAQKHGEWGVQIEFGPPGPQIEMTV